MKKLKFVLLGWLLCATQVESFYCQQGSITYQTLTMGYNSSLYRDFATSPLFYRGSGINLQTSWLKYFNHRVRIFEMALFYNSMSADIPASNYLQPSAFATFIQLHFRYLRLWDFNRLSNEKRNIKLGGSVVNTTNIRPNSGLFNNALGVENITNIMATLQITRDISRMTERKINLGIFKPVLKPKKMECRFQLNAGLLNVNSRPGYAFSYADELNGLETAAWILSDYRLSVNGWRFNTELEWIKYLPNGNARSWAYVWDAAHVPGKFEAFQMATHQIRYTLYFNTTKN